MPATERWLQDQVRALCAGLGLAVQHIERSDLAKAWLPGWPDLWIAGPGGILYRELKGPQGRMDREQLRVGGIITKAGGNFNVWYPRDLLTGRIQRELTAISATGRNEK